MDKRASLLTALTTLAITALFAVPAYAGADDRFPLPEPGTLALLAAGLGSVVWWARRRR